MTPSSPELATLRFGSQAGIIRLSDDLRRRILSFHALLLQHQVLKGTDFFGRHLMWGNTAEYTCIKSYFKEGLQAFNFTLTQENFPHPSPINPLDVHSTRRPVCKKPRSRATPHDKVGRHSRVPV
ncbi:histidine--tRNA ligase [Striga asiatica]|uniref:Histidine--tRNA ligase n=1 Tax=Striga asiatica TaxID=4170 RepID=A0A5A7PHJ6_STRAF|nr:histidine--tRNA ligase [Striga asiatica]